MEFIDVTIRESIYLKNGMTESKALKFLEEYVKLMPFEEIKYLELCFLDNHTKGTLLYDAEFITAAYEIVKGHYGLTAVLHPQLVDINKWDPDIIKKFASVRFMINEPMDKHCEEIIDYVHELGVGVSVNIIYISRKDMNFVDDCLKIACEHKVETFTIADSCGRCLPSEAVELVGHVKSVNSEFRRNFHFHDHFKLALANAIACMEYIDLLDCSIHGYGKGGGNLNLECILFAKRLMKGEDIPKELVVYYSRLLKYLAKNILEDDWVRVLEEYRNLLIGLYNLNLKDINDIEAIAGDDILNFCKVAAEKGIKK